MQQVFNATPTSLWGTGPWKKEDLWLFSLVLYNASLKILTQREEWSITLNESEQCAGHYAVVGGWEVSLLQNNRSVRTRPFSNQQQWQPNTCCRQDHYTTTSGISLVSGKEAAWAIWWTCNLRAVNPSFHFSDRQEKHLQNKPGQCWTGFISID